MRNHTKRRAIFVSVVVLLATGLLSACQPHEIAAWQAMTTHRQGIQNHPFLACVRHHESDRGSPPYTNGYQAKNPRSTASGAYQFLDSTWRNVSGAAGHPGYPSARSAPSWAQDAVAYWAMTHPKQAGRPWAGTGC